MDKKRKTTPADKPAETRGRKRVRVIDSPTIQKVARLVASGLPTKDIAAKMNVKAVTIRRYYKTPGFRELVATSVGREGRDLMRRVYPATVRQLVNLAGLEERADGTFAVDLDPKDRKTAVKACASLLVHATRAGIGAEAEEAAPELADAMERAVGVVAISCTIQQAREKPDVEALAYDDADD